MLFGSTSSVLVAALAAHAYGATLGDNCCSLLLKQDIPLLYPGTTSYDTRQKTYFDIKQQSLTPNCIAQPRNTQQVSRVVKTLAEAKCKFAIRSGGHTPYAGASNINNGVTLDLQYLNSVQYDSKSKTAKIGPGARWRQVYEVLEPMGVLTTGGRASPVGVGGLVTGGGISYLSPRYGFVCDSVVEMEVVLADGKIVKANKEKNADLLRVLKGGNNNFGVVTSLEFKTFKFNGMWGGNQVYPQSTIESQLKGIKQFTDNIDKDPDAAAIVIQVYFSDTQTEGIMNLYAYGQPVTTAPKAFDQLRTIPGSLTESTGPINMTTFADFAAGNTEWRVFFGTLTFANDLRVMMKANEIYLDVLAKVKATATGNWSVNILYQPLPPAYWRNAGTTGGNILGFERFPKQALCLYQPYFQWQDKAQDALFHAAATEIINRIDTYAKSVGLSNPYLYLDYADASQNPLASYGAESVKKMKAASKKYDPNGVFQRLVPGGFKLSEA